LNLAHPLNDLTLVHDHDEKLLLLLLLTTTTKVAPFIRLNKNTFLAKN